MCVCVCGLLTSLGAVGKTSEHSSKQQITDEDKTVLFLYDKSVFESVPLRVKRKRVSICMCVCLCVCDREREKTQDRT